MKGRLPLDRAEIAISELRAISTVQRVTVSGGEPFLDFDYLTAIARRTAIEKLAFRVVTNGSFAESDDLAMARLRTLQDIGLESLALSWDEFHHRFLDPARVRTLLRSARRLGISVRVTVVVTKSKSVASSIALLESEGFELPFTQVRCLPVGRAARQVSRDDLLPVPAWDRGRACRNDFDTLSITHDGSVYPCCAVGGFTPGLRLGSVHSEPLEDLLRRRETDLRWIALATKGPSSFLRYATAEEFVTLGIDEGMHDCVKCHRLFSSPLGDILVNRSKAALHAEADRIVAGTALSIPEETGAASKR